ncbi:MAG: hypothetical protein RQ714_08250 [Nitrosomonas sp.]|nr:hypothetical protein [Nitrosomonas sp.]
MGDCRAQTDKRVLTPYLVSDFSGRLGDARNQAIPEAVTGNRNKLTIAPLFRNLKRAR